MKKITKEDALAYARATVQDPDNHEDAVQAVAEDYFQGVIDAYESENEQTTVKMKKIDLILNGKVDAKLIDTKKAKITKAIEVGILNAEDDLLSKELEYANAMATLGGAHQYEPILCDLVRIKQKIIDIKSGIEALKAVQADLDEEVEDTNVEVEVTTEIEVK